jgi:hypothetical protein
MTRIASIDLNRFKGLERLYQLGPATLLSGPNGSGKSAALEGLAYCLGGAVPEGRSLDIVALYFPERGGRVTVRDEGGNWIRRGITKDAEKAKVSEVLETSEDDAGTYWRCTPEVLDLKEFLALSPAKRREWVLRLCGSGEIKAGELMKALSKEVAREIGGPGATVDMFTREGLLDLPQEIHALAEVWAEDRGIYDVLESHLVSGASTSETCLRLLDVAREEKLAQRRRATEARAAIRELEAAAKGARAGASEIRTAKAAVEALQDELSKVKSDRARYDEAKRHATTAATELQSYEKKLAEVKADAKQPPGRAPEPPPPDTRREELLQKLAKANEEKALILKIEGDWEGKLVEERRAGDRLSAALESMEEHKQSQMGLLVSISDEIPDEAHEQMPALREVITAMSTQWTEALDKLSDEIDAATAAFDPARLDEAQMGAQEAHTIYKAAVEKELTIRTSVLSLEAVDPRVHEKALAAWMAAEKAWAKGQETIKKWEAVVETSGKTLDGLRARLAALPEPPAAEETEARLYGAKEALERAERASGAVRAYEEALSSAERAQVLEEAWKRCERAIRTVQETLVGQSTAPLLSVVNNLFQKAGRHERVYLELENDRGKPIFELGWTKDGKRVSLRALSAGETVLLTAALSVAIALKSPGRKLLLVEADPLDPENLRGLFPALLPWAEKLDALIVATASPVEDPEGWTVMRLGQEVTA